MKSTEMACPSGLSSSTGHPGTSGNIFQLRREVQVQSQKLKTVDASRKPSFADAVAFASGTSKGKAHRTQNATTVHLAGNKRMRVPTKIVKGAGPRQLASKWKK